MTRRSQSGFTLIEMMVALVLFSFAIVGILAVATSMAGNVKEQRQVVQTETDVRAPMDFLSDSLRMASPSIQTGNIQDATISNCTVVDTANGFNGVGALAMKDSTTGPDQLDVVYAYGASIATLQTPIPMGTTTLAVNVTNDANQASQIFAGDNVLVSNTAQGTIFNVTAVNASTGVLTLHAACGWTTPSTGYNAGSLVLRVMRARYLIQNVDGIPTLMMDPDADGPAAPQPLAEGIEDMQIAIGLDTDSNYSIDTWEYSTGNTPVVGQPRAIRITLVARGDSALSGAATNGQRKAAEDHAIGTADNIRRRYLTTTIELRNFGGSP